MPRYNLEKDVVEDTLDGLGRTVMLVMLMLMPTNAAAATDQYVGLVGLVGPLGPGPCGSCLITSPCSRDTLEPQLIPYILKEHL